MSFTVSSNSLSVEEFLDRSFREIVEMGRELIFYVNNPIQRNNLDSIGKRIGEMKEASGRLNFKKIEEISHLLENIYYYVGTEKISLDEKLISVCLRANNLCCDILKSIKRCGLEKSKNYKYIIGDMMGYLEYSLIEEYPVKEEEFIDSFANKEDDGYLGENKERCSEEARPTMKTIPVLIIKSGNIIFCVKQRKIIFVEKVNDKSIEYIRNMEFYRCDSEAFPIVRINKFFNLSEGDNNDAQIAIVEEEGKRFGIVVDQILSGQEVAIKKLDMGFPGQDIYGGAAITNEDGIGFVLNLAELYRDHFSGKKVNIAKRAMEDENSLQDEQTQVLIFELEDKKVYGIPINFVERLDTFMRERVEWSGEQAVVLRGDKVLPIVNFRRMPENSDKEVCCIVVNVNGVKKGLVASRILDMSTYENRMPAEKIMGTKEIDGRSVTIVNPEIFWNPSCEWKTREM